MFLSPSLRLLAMINRIFYMMCVVALWKIVISLFWLNMLYMDEAAITVKLLTENLSHFSISSYLCFICFLLIQTLDVLLEILLVFPKAEPLRCKVRIRNEIM